MNLMEQKRNGVEISEPIKAFMQNTKHEALWGHYTMLLRRISGTWVLLLKEYEPFIKKFSLTPVKSETKNTEDNFSNSFVWDYPRLTLSDNEVFVLKDIDNIVELRKKLLLLGMDIKTVNEFQSSLTPMLETMMFCNLEIPPLGECAMMVVTSKSLRLNSGISPDCTHFSEFV